MIGGVDLGPTKDVVILWIVSALTVAIFGFAARSRTRVALMMRYGIEAVVVYTRREVHIIFHEDADTYLHYFLTLFFFILIANLFGLLPEGASVTGNINVTAALAFCTFALINFAGVKKQGLLSYIKHIVPSGLPFWLVPILFPIEIMGLFAKCIALCIRIFANMVAGHAVSLAFLSLIFIFAASSKFVGVAVAPVSVGMALFAYTLDVLVALLQAYIFTVLTALFVGAAVHPH